MTISVTDLNGRGSTVLELEIRAKFRRNAVCDSELGIFVQVAAPLGCPLQTLQIMRDGACVVYY